MRAGGALLLLVLFVVPVGQIEPVAAQVEHAPTPEQCRADADAWGIPNASVLFPNEEQFSQLSGALVMDRNITAKMLEARTKQLSQCIRTDIAGSTRYSEAVKAYTIAELVRIAKFVERHKLTPQFLEEDEQGQR